MDLLREMIGSAAERLMCHALFRRRGFVTADRTPPDIFAFPTQVG